MTQKEKIIEHVSSMIISLGVKSVRMDDVASEVGVSKRTLYEMFGDKEELLFQSLVYIMDERQRKLSEKTKGCQNMMEMMLVSVRELCVGGHNSDFEHRLTTNLSKFYPNVLEKIRRHHTEMGYRGLKYALDRCRAEGLLDPHVKVDIMSKLFFSTLSIYMSQTHGSILPEGISREEAVKIITINFLRGISSIKGLEVIDKTLLSTKTFDSTDESSKLKNSELN